MAANGYQASSSDFQLNRVAARAGSLTLNQWQIWAVLALAGACAYMSLTLHRMNAEELAMAGTLQQIDRLEQLTGQSKTLPRDWMLPLAMALPLADRFSINASLVRSRVASAVEQMAGGAPLNSFDRNEIAQGIAAVRQDLRGVLQAHRQSIAQMTHLYYFGVIGLILALVALWAQRLQLRVAPPLPQLMSDNNLFAHAPVPLSLSDASDRLLRVNKAYAQVSGYDPEQLRGVDALCLDTPEEKIVAARMRKALLSQGHWVGDYHIRHKSGSVVTEKVIRMAIGEDSTRPEGYLTIGMDSGSSDEQQRFMMWQAHHDNLTKLPNANLLQERLVQEIQLGRQGGLISINLDGFTFVNDSVGHVHADRILTDAAMRIAMAANEHDTVARMGGDHFVIMVVSIDEVAEVEKIARAAIAAFEQPFFVEDSQLFIGASAGVSIFPDDGSKKGELLQKADSACLLAKKKGGNLVEFFEEEMNAAASRRFAIESNLRSALGGEQFELYFQPIIDISREEIYGAEALLRWHSPALGVVSPGEFIPVAEASGLIVDVGNWVVHDVQSKLRQWRDFAPNLRISLNVSARQFADPVQAAALLALLDSDVSEQVTIELTESAVVDDAPGAAAFLRGLRDLGMRIALDDFGTGYSSIGYLRDYEFDVLKVDKSFIDNISGVRDLGLVASIVSMGRILGMRVVAEGVENRHQIERLKHIGCDFVQGYYFAKPLPAADFADFLQSWDACSEAV